MPLTKGYAMNNNVCVNEWVLWLGDVRRLRSATISVYKYTMDEFVRHIRSVPFDAVNAEMVESFMCRVRTRGRMPAPATQNRDRNCLMSFYKFMQSRGLAQTNPAELVGRPVVRNRQIKAIPDDVWESFWGSHITDPDRVWIGLGVFCGLRRRELVTVSPRHFDLKSQTINHLERKGGGTYSIEYGEMARIVAQGLPQVLPDVEGWLSMVANSVNYRASQNATVLVPFDAPAPELTRYRMSLTEPGIPDPGAINKRLAKLIARSGLERNVFSPHSLRHTCATNLMRCGVPVEVLADQLGHSSIETTRRYLNTSNQLGAWRVNNAKVNK